VSFGSKHQVLDSRGAAACGLTIADPLGNSNWNSFPARFPEASIFHTREWAQVLSETYGYKPHYFTSASSGISLALCLFEIDSWLTGKRAVSLPFSDESPVLGAQESPDLLGILELALEFGRAQGWKTIEVRGTPSDYNGKRSDAFYSHELDLGLGAERLAHKFESGVRRAIRKAEKSGVETEVRTDLRAIDEYFALHCLTRRKHRVPPQPLRFFQNIHRHLISRGMGFTVLARLNGQVLAGAVFLHYRGKGLYKFGASHPEMDQFRPSNFVMWQAIQTLCELGNHSLSFGRTSLNQEGLRRYKLGWGTREREISYVKLNVASRSYLSQSGSAHANWLFGKLPIPLLRRIGALVYPHIG
jgi:hypothetical protein